MDNNILTSLEKVFSYREVLKSNVINNGVTIPSRVVNTGFFTSGNNQVIDYNNGTGLIGISSVNTIEIYYRKVNELKKFELTEIVKTIVTLYTTYILSSIKPTKTPISILDPKYKKYEDLLNSKWNELGLVNELVNNLPKFIYYGSYSINLNYNYVTNRLEKRHLHDPVSVVPTYKNGKKISNLVQSKDGIIYEIPPNSILRFGFNDLSLTSDKFNKEEEENNGIIKVNAAIAAEPLFYGNLNKLKEYLLKDQLLSLLGIKELIQPLIYLIKVDKNTAPETAAKLATNTQMFLNEALKSSESFLTGTFTEQELLQALLQNIKAVPDYNSSVENLGTLDVSKLKDRIADLRAEQEVNEENILNSASMPVDLYKNRTSSWEAIKSAERLNAKVNYYVTAIKRSTKQISQQLLFLYTGEFVDEDSFQDNFFSKTVTEYTNSINNADVVSSIITSVKNLLEDAKGIVSDNDLLDKEEFLKYFRKSLLNIDPEFSTMITDKLITDHLESQSIDTKI